GRRPRRAARSTGPSAACRGRGRSSWLRRVARCARVVGRRCRLCAQLTDVQLGHFLLERLGNLPQPGVLTTGRLQLVGELLELRATGHETGQLAHGDLALGPVAEAAAALEDEE